MKSVLKSLILLMVFSYTNTYAATHLVTSNAGNNPWAPGAGSFAEAVTAAVNSGDTIIFDYATLGNSPTITLPANFNQIVFGGFVVDGARNLPVASDVVKFIVSGAPGQFQAGIDINRANTTLRRIDLGNVAANGIFITSANNTIDSCTIHDCDYHGINITAAGSNATIKNSSIYNNNAAAIANNGHDNAAIYSLGATTIVDSCYIYGNGANGILIRNAAAINAEIKNSVIGRDPNGVESGNAWNGIFVWSANNPTIQGNIIVNNGQNPMFSQPDKISGIRLQQLTGGVIDTNYIGTDPAKTSAGNAFDGITLHTNVSGVNITSNIICYNGFLSALGNGGGYALRNSVTNTVTSSNWIGAHPDMTDGGNNDYGISIESSYNNTFGGANLSDGNVVAFHNDRGIWINFATTTNNELYNNTIINNDGAGIQIASTAKQNIIGALNQGNNIAGNQYGILIQNSGANHNTLRYNSFSCNTVEGISLQSGGNDDYGNGNAVAAKDVIVNTAEKRANFVSGLAPSAGATIDIYVADNICPMACDNAASQGMTMVATVTASSTPSGNGLYFWEYDFVAGGNLVTKNNVVVLATEAGAAGATNTSEFSVCENLCNIPVNSAINSADLNLCPNESTVLTANANGIGSDSYSYSWYQNSISIGNLVNYEIDDSTYTVDEAGTYYVIIASQLDSASCSDTTTTAVVVVNTQPTVNITPSANLVCTGSSITLDGGTSGANLSILWKPNGETTNNITVTTGDTYEIVVTNTATGCLDSADITITEAAPPALAMASPFFCQGDSTMVTAGISGMTYAWTPSSNTTESFYVTAEGTHDVTVTDPATGCFSTGSTFADQSSDPKPTVSLPEDSMMCYLQGQTIDITATFTSSSTGTLTWSDGTIDDLTITASDTTDYIAVYEDAVGCTGADTMNISNACLPPDPLLPNIVTIDNPWTPFGEITPDQFLTSNLVIYDRWGLEMFSSSDVLPVWTGKTKNDRDCPSGVYFFVWEYKDITEKTYKYNGFLHLIQAN